MLSAIANTLSTRTSYSQSKLVNVVPDQKDQELIVPDDQVISRDDAETIERSIDQEEASGGSLSTRAEQVKESLLATEGVTVSAVLLSQNGSKVSQTKYNTSASLKQANSIIGGRPTIIGSLESINAICITSIHSLDRDIAPKNGNGLPYPLCNAGTINGDVLIYSVDNDANACDLSIDAYSKYCDANKELTSQEIKNGSQSERSIKPVSLVPNDSGYTLQSLSRELANQYVEANKGNDYSNSEIASFVSSKIENIISESIANDSPLNDPDYDVEDDRSTDPDYDPTNEDDRQQELIDISDDVDDEQNVETVERIKDIYWENNGVDITERELDLLEKEVNEINEKIGDDADETDLDESVWRSELDDALNYVRAKAVFDGELLAQAVSEIYLDANGSKPSKSNMETIFEEMQCQLADEARNDADVNEEEWREQLDDALDYVRAKGRADGKQLAAQISDIYYQQNGSDPTQDELEDIFASIQSELANEALSEMNDEEEDIDESVWRSELNEALVYAREQGRIDREKLLNGEVGVYEYEIDVVEDDGSAFAFLTLNDMDNLDEADPVDLIEYSSRLLSETMVSQVISSYNITKRRDPTPEEFADSVAKMTDNLADKIALSYENDEEADDDESDADYDPEQDVYSDDDEEADDYSDEESDDDSDYDPENEQDQRLKESDLVDDVQASADFDDNNDAGDYFDDNDVVDGMLQSAVRYSKLNGNGESYSLYFGELPNLSQESEMLESVLDSFKMRNGRIPNAQEMHVLKQTVIIPDRDSIKLCDARASSDEKDDEKASELVVRGRGIEKTKAGPKQTKLLVTPVKEKKNKSARYEILLNESTVGSAKKEKTAIHWFEKFNNRKPSKEEIENIKRFVEIDDSDNLRCELFDVQDDNDNTGYGRFSSDSNVVRSLAVKTNKATKYTLGFKDGDFNESGDIEQACKWFERFNGRKPNKEELRNICAFTQNDVNDTIDID